MSLRSHIPEALRVMKGLPERIERGALAIREFTCVLPLRGDPPGGDLHTKLAALNQEMTPGGRSAFTTAFSLHSARLMLFGDTDRTENRQVERRSKADSEGPLVFNLVYDGSREDLLSYLLEGSPELVDVFGYCEGFPAERDDAGAIIAWLTRARLRGGYFFSDVDCQSRAEIDESAELWQAFLGFYKVQQTPGTSIDEQDGNQLRSAFAKFWKRQDGQILPFASHLEERIAHEERWSRRVAELTERAQLRDRRHGRSDQEQLLRANHAKHHAGLKAVFFVHEDIPQRLKRGLFKQSKPYEAFVRLSNGSSRARPDRFRDARGFAIKVKGVSGQRALHAGLQLVGAEIDGAPFVTSADDIGDEPTQDFVLINHPRFPAKNIEEFAVLLSAVQSGDRWRWLRLTSYFLRRPRALRILLGTMQRIDHPFDIPYHSATPYLLGDPAEGGIAVKYSVRAKLGTQRKSFCRKRPDRDTLDFLANEVAETLHPNRGEAVVFEFCLHVPKENSKRLVEDATADWSEAEVVPVATIMIAPQDCGSVEARARCESAAFSPWNSLAAHRPLGSLNRARLLTYLKGAKNRGAAPPGGGVGALPLVGPKPGLAAE